MNPLQNWQTELAGWQKALYNQVRPIILGSDSSVTESIKWGQPYFDLHGGFIKLYFAKDWVNIYFYKGYLLESKLFETSDNARMRTVKVRPSDQIDSEQFKDLVRKAAALNL